MIRQTSLLVAASLAAVAVGDDIALDYNWNGLVHDAEVFEVEANSPMGYRSISDRGHHVGTADSLGETTGQVFGVYGNFQLEMNADTPDCIFIGHRNASPIWDDVADGDGLGTQPTWDPTGGTGDLAVATQTFAAPIAMNGGSDVSFLYTASNSGGDFLVTLNFTDSTSVSVYVNAPDWFADFDPEPTPPLDGVEWQYKLPGNLSDGDGFAATQSQDAAIPGAPLIACEAVITTDSLNTGVGFNMSGKMLESVTFDATDLPFFNPDAAITILALNVNGSAVTLDANWNGMVHASELNVANTDQPDGYRSIGDRGLTVDDADSIGGGEGEVITDYLTYHLEPNPAVVDTIFVGTRSRPWDDVADGDDFGIPPSWDPTGGTGVLTTWTTVLPTPITMSSTSTLGLLYDASEGGGYFDMTLEFGDGSTATVSIHAPDWYANGNHVANAPNPGVATQVVLPGPLSAGDGWSATSNTDYALRGAPLNVTEATVTADSLMSGLGFDVDGRSLEYITFTSQFTGFQAVGIYAMAHDGGETPCPADVNGDGIVDFFDVQQVLNWYSAGDLRADFIADGVLDFFDIQAYLNYYSAGCP